LIDLGDPHFTDTTPIKDTSFTVGENNLLIHLLLKVGREGFRWPTEACMRIAHAVVPFPATELVITRIHDEKLQILLAVYEGGVKEYAGLRHLPGGYFKNSLTDEQEACSAVAKRELGFDVRYLRSLDVHWWRLGEHPYGRPLSVFMQCVAENEIIETGTLQFFPVDDLPEMVPVHKNFIRECFRQFPQSVQ